MAQPVSLYSWSLAHLTPYRARVAVVAVLSLVEIGLAALAPWPLKLVVDSVLGTHPLPPIVARLAAPFAASSAGLLVAIVVTGIVLQIANELVRVGHTQLQVEMGQRVVYDLRARLLAHLQALPPRPPSNTAAPITPSTVATCLLALPAPPLTLPAPLPQTLLFSLCHQSSNQNLYLHPQKS